MGLKEHMMVKVEGLLGPDKSAGEDQEVLCLNRIFRWVPERGDQCECIEIEGDPRHCEILLAQYGLIEGSRGVVTPGVTSKTADPGAPSTAFRSVVMRINYLATDRPELSYPAKEAAAFMASPCELGETMTKRMARFLCAHPRLTQRMERQQPVVCMDGFSDANHAGCLRTRRSTSCSVIMHGAHCMQPIALSSAESEWYAMVRTATVLTGKVNMAWDFRVKLSARLLGDATAAAGIGSRRGAGR
eukprot:6489422-Amphidinium_carterae.4